jgi:hypothetical protein
MPVHVPPIVAVIHMWHTARYGREFGARDSAASTADGNKVTDMVTVSGDGILLAAFQAVHDLS